MSLRENYDNGLMMLTLYISDCDCVQSWARLGLSYLALISQTEDIIASIPAEMIQLWQAAVLALSVGTSTSSRQFLPLFDREPRSLRDAFPFSVQSEDNEIREERQVRLDH